MMGMTAVMRKKWAMTITIMTIIVEAATARTK